MMGALSTLLLRANPAIHANRREPLGDDSHDSHESQDSQAPRPNPSAVDSQDSQRLHWNGSEGNPHESQDSQTFTGRLRALHRIADAEGVASALVAGMDARDVHACAGLSRDGLTAYLRALTRAQHMAMGRVPIGWTREVECNGCGPVLLWPDAPAAVVACPWCGHRKAGRTIPKPHAPRPHDSRRHPRPAET